MNICDNLDKLEHDEILGLYNNECALELFQWISDKGNDVVLQSEKISPKCRIIRINRLPGSRNSFPFRSLPPRVKESSLPSSVRGIQP